MHISELLKCFSHASNFVIAAVAAAVSFEHPKRKDSATVQATAEEAPCWRSPKAYLR